MIRTITALCLIWAAVVAVVLLPRMDAVTATLIVCAMIATSIALVTLAAVVTRLYSAPAGAGDLERPDNDAGQGALVLTPHVPRENPMPAPDGMGAE